MANFQIEHNWQNIIERSSALIGESIKVRWLIFLCLLWIGFGLIGHEPWKSQESHVVGNLYHYLKDPQWVISQSYAHNQIPNYHHLYYFVAKIFAKIFIPLGLSIRDSAVLSNILWMVLTFLFVGLIGEKLCGKGLGRQSVLALLSVFGLVLPAHLLTPDLAALTGLTIGVYSLTQPYKAYLNALILFVGLSIAFFSGGILSSLILILTTLALLFFFRQWQAQKRFFMAGLLSFGFMVLAWGMLHKSDGGIPLLWTTKQSPIGVKDYLQFLRSFLWMTLPIFPLAVLRLWQVRHVLFETSARQLVVSYGIIALVLIFFLSPQRESAILFLLPAIVFLAVMSLEHINRQTLKALTSLSYLFFIGIVLLIALIWISLKMGYPQNISVYLRKVSGNIPISTSGWVVLVSIFISLFWFILLMKKPSCRSLLRNLALSITVVWILFSVLLLPYLDIVKSYRPIAEGICQHLPTRIACIQSGGVGQGQKNLLDYYGITLYPTETLGSNVCDFYLIQDTKNQPRISLGKDWKLLWEGKRSADRGEVFRLYHLQGT